GQLGAALASFTTMAMINLARYALVRRMFHIRIIGKPVATATALAIISAGIVRLLLSPIDDRTLLFTVFEVTAFLTFFAAAACALLMTDQDRDTAANVFGPFRGLVGRGK